MQPKKTKQQTKQQKIKEKREEKDLYQQKQATIANKSSQKLLEAAQQVRILNEPIKYEGPEIKVLTSGSKRVDYYMGRIQESLLAVPKLRLFAVGRALGKLVTTIEKLKPLLPKLKVTNTISREGQQPRLDIILNLE